MNKNFEQYMNEKIPTWKTDLALETIEYIKDLHKKVNDYQAIADNIFYMNFNQNKTGIDYSTDWNKANENLNNSYIELERNIKEIQKVINPNMKIEEQINKTM